MRARYLAVWLPSTIGLVLGSLESIWGILSVMNQTDEYPVEFVALSVSVLLLSIMGLMVFKTLARRDKERSSGPKKF